MKITNQWLSKRRNLAKQSLPVSVRRKKRELLRILALFTEEIFLSLHHAMHVRKQQSQTARTERRTHPGCTENKLAPISDGILGEAGISECVNYVKWEQFTYWEQWPNKSHSKNS